MPLQNRSIKEKKERLLALHKLRVFLDLQPDNPNDLEQLDRRRVAMSIDGGGFFVFWSLQLIKDIERIAGLPCYRLFDIIGGTSSGAMTAPLLAQGMSAIEVEEFWKEQAPTLWPYRMPATDFLMKTARSLGLQQMSYWTWIGMLNWFPPLYSKTNFRATFKEVFGNRTLRDIADEKNCGVAVFARNVSSTELISMGAYARPFGGADNPYANVLARSAVEAATSPPAVIQPTGRFVDAGYGPANNPEVEVISSLLQWFVEQYQAFEKELQMPVDTYEFVEQTLADWLQAFRDQNSMKMTFKKKDVGSLLMDIRKIRMEYDRVIRPRKPLTVFSIGSGVWPLLRASERIMQNPPMTNVFWLFWLLYIYDVESSHIQSSFLDRSPIFPWMDYRRFQMTYNRNVITERLGNRDLPPIPGLSVNRTHDLTEQDLMYMQDGLSPEFIPFYTELGKAVVDYIHTYQAFPYCESLENSLLNKGSELMEELADLSDPAWIDSQPTGRASPFQPPPFWYFAEQYS